MFAILKRELRSYFHTPAAYVFLTVLLAFFGLFFTMYNVFPRASMYGMSPASADFGPVINSMILVLLFVLPILVMKLISEERRQKTDQLLHTVPLTTVDIVVAKYLSALTIFILSLVISLVYPLMVFVVTKAAWVSMQYLIAVYLGFFLVGASFIAICIFASAITESQIVAAILGFFFILSMWLLQFVRDNVQTEFLKDTIDWISLLKRFEDFQSGIIKVAPVIYYISIVIVFLFLTVRAIDKRRWTEG